jgi:DNA-binding winged helix-turn-helix (wHTH) protein
MVAPRWSFADFCLDPAHACLWHGAAAVPLAPKAFDVLYYLVTHADRLVSKDELLDAVWPETAVNDTVVRITIGKVRRALGDTAQTPQFIATVRRRGYRFLAVVSQAAPPAVASRTPSAYLQGPLRPPSPSRRCPDARRA